MLSFSVANLEFIALQRNGRLFWYYNYYTDVFVAGVVSTEIRWLWGPFLCQSQFHSRCHKMGVMKQKQCQRWRECRKKQCNGLISKWVCCACFGAYFTILSTPKMLHENCLENENWSLFERKWISDENGICLKFALMKRLYMI